MKTRNAARAGQLMRDHLHEVRTFLRSAVH